jgi:hypothetical protein
VLVVVVVVMPIVPVRSALAVAGEEYCLALAVLALLPPAAVTEDLDQTLEPQLGWASHTVVEVAVVGEQQVAPV